MAASSRRQVYVWVVYFLVVMYALCYQLQQPLEPFLVDKLIGDDKGSESAVIFGQLKSFFSFVQCIGSLTFGYILDRYGLRVGFTINFVACAATYYILSIVSSVNLLFLSKVPAVFQAGFLCAQTAISKLTDEGDERVTALGRLTTAYTIGGVVGPALGGLIGSQGNYTLGANFAVAGSLLSVVLVLLLPSDIDDARTTTKPEGKGKSKKKSDSSGAPASDTIDRGSGDGDMSWVAKVGMVLRLVGLCLFVKVATGVTNSMAGTVRPLILKDKLGIDEAGLGSFMSASFAFGGFANAFLLAPFKRLLGGKLDRVILNCLLCMGSAYAIQAGLYHPEAASLGILPDPSAAGGYYSYPFIALSFLLSVFQYSLSTVITAATTSIVADDAKGTLMGLEHSLFAAARVVGPSMGILAFNTAGISGISLACAVGFFIILAVWVLFGKTTVKMLADKQAESEGGAGVDAKMRQKSE